MTGHVEAESITLTTSDGFELEAQRCRPDGATATVVLAHAHPLRGGSMRAFVTSALFQALPPNGLAVLRFNFRGVGTSGGTYGDGIDEQLDLRAAIDHAAAWAVGPLVVSGWSFGADVSLAVLDDRISAWFAVAPPLRILPPEAFLAAAEMRPKQLVVPERDAFNPPDDARARTAGWINTVLTVVPGADHFLVGRTEPVVDALLAFTATLTSPGGEARPL